MHYVRWIFVRMHIKNAVSRKDKDEHQKVHHAALKMEMID